MRRLVGGVRSLTPPDEAPPASRWVVALSRTRDESLPATGPIRRWLGTSIIVLLIQLVGLAAPIVLHDLVATLWWLVPVIVAATALAVAGRPSAVPSHRAARTEAISLGLLLLLQIACVILTQSRGPWLGLLAGATAFLVLLQQAGGVNRRLLVGTIAAIVFLGIFLVVFNLRSSPLAPMD